MDSEDDEEIDQVQEQETQEQAQVPSLRGAPVHMRSEIRRMQNVEYARRSRERRREEFRGLVEKHDEQIMRINQLEERISALVQILLENSIAVPANTAQTVQQSLENESDGLPSSEQLFEEFARVLDNNDGGGAGPSSSGQAQGGTDEQ